jgi:hypothetical protein
MHDVFVHSFKKEWYETYWVIDIHSTVIKPSYDLSDKSMNYYPFAKEVLQILTKRKDINLIMWTSSYPHEIESYLSKFKEDGIHFNNVNENPNISSNKGNFGYYEKKFYFNVLFDDKAGFRPLKEWEALYNIFKYYEDINYLPNPKWSTKY